MATLLERLQDPRREAPRLRPREAVVRFGATGAALAAALPGAGRAVALTRDEHAMRERRGGHGGVSADLGRILVLGPDIDLRLFSRSWAHASAPGGERPSIQIFDRDGAVTSIELFDAADDAPALLSGAREPGRREREDRRAAAAVVAERRAAPPAAGDAEAAAREGAA